MKVIGENEVKFQLKSSTGPMGPAGPQGPKGDKGDRGEPGPRGLTGATGPKGEKGDKGERGETGATGATGPQGEKGEKGETGATGAQGPQGEKGETGATGPQGPQGIQGETGPQGEQGPQGEKGEKGDKGDTGPQGPAGSIDNLHIAGPAQLGGVMPVAKTEEMTQSVGVDEAGGLWSMPGGENLSYEDTVLASGVVPSGCAQWTDTDTGLTADDLRQWKIIGVLWQSTQSNFVGLSVGGINVLYQNSTQAQALIEFVDSKRTIIQTRNIYTNSAFFDVNSSLVNNLRQGHTGSQYAWLIKPNGGAVKIYTHNATTAELTWKIWGVIKG